MLYECSCEDKGKIFKYCATHLMSKDRWKIIDEWLEHPRVYTWESYKKRFVQTLNLKPFT